MVSVSMTSKGQIVIPASIRKRHNFKKGAKLCIEEKGDLIIIRPLTPEYFNKTAGILNTQGKLSETLLKERSKDKKKEK